MLRLLADENFNSDIVRGLLFRMPEIELVRVQDVGLSGAADPVILAWAAENKWIVVTHDRATLPDFAYQRVIDGELMPGVFVANDRLPVGQVINELVLVATCSTASEWAGRVLYLPL